MRRVWLWLTCLLATPLVAGEYFTLQGHGGPIMGIAVSPTGQIATASFDNAVGVWSGDQPTWLDGHEAAVNTVTFADSGTAFSGGDDYALIRWDLSTGASTRLLGHKGKVMAIAVSPDGETIATASWDYRIGLWPRDGGDPRFLVGHSGPVSDVAFSSDGHYLFSTSADGTLRQWDLALGTEHRRVVEHGFGINELVLNDRAGWLAYGAVDGGTRALDLDSGASLADLTLGRRPILALEPNSDGSVLAVGDGEGYIMLVDTTRWRILSDFRATARGPVWALAFSPDGGNIHAGGLDNTLYSWPVDDLQSHGIMATGDKPFLADPATLPNGERQFKRKCSICHTLTPGSARRAGPSLYDLFGRPAGTVDDYIYSEALTDLDLVWSEATIDALFDIGPEHYIPGTKMPMQRITGQQDRADLIQYLKDNTKPRE